MTCDVCRYLLTRYLNCELEDAQNAEVEEHLATCAECAQQCEQQRSALETVDPQGEAPIVRIANVILERARREGATDIEIRFVDPGTHVYYRIEGTMHEVMRLPGYVHQRLVNRFRMMANLLLTDRRAPQEGRIQMQVQDESLDLEVAVMPQGDFVSMHFRSEGEEEYRRPAIKCDTCREMLTAYLKAELEDAQKAEVEEHLATCAACAAEAEGARRVLAEMDRASEPTIVALAREIIEEAIKQQASDIHLQPLQGDARVRLRIDGVLHELRRLSTETHHALADQYRIMAAIPLAERRMGQDGRILFEREGKEYDLRVSVVPSIHGSAVVMRILDKSGVNLTLDQVQLVGEQRQQLNKMLYANTGMMFVTGPTGSGKTTTLYAILHQLNEPEVSLMSVEDPVEYQIDGITQMHINPPVGFGFKAAMRYILRQDPDIIMCGETRDLETAEVMAQAAITGHLVLGTLHTDDAVSVIRRLLDMGLDRFMITSSLLGATAQRLLRRLCPECKEEYEPTEIERAWLHDAGIAEVPAKLWRGRGCDNCRSTGYRGRVAVYEIFRMDDDILQLMAVKKAPLEEIEKLAATKVKPMRLTAAEKVLAGETTAGEAMRVMAYLPEY